MSQAYSCLLPPSFFSKVFISKQNFHRVLRKGPLNHRTPDFSKVEPRVRFPKGDYTPPKSQRPSKRESLSPEPPLVFKSPADIVKEVLLNVSDGAPATSDSYGPPASAPNFTVPQEFRSRQNATMLLEQLQVKVEASALTPGSFSVSCQRVAIFWADLPAWTHCLILFPSSIPSSFRPLFPPFLLFSFLRLLAAGKLQNTAD